MCSRSLLDLQVYDLVRFTVWLVATALSYVPIDAVSEFPNQVDAMVQFCIDWFWAQYEEINTSTSGALNEVEWFLRSRHIMWAGNIAWNVGPGLVGFIFPPADWNYHRNQVTELKAVRGV